MCHTDDENVQVSVSDCNDSYLIFFFFSLEEQQFKVYCFPLLIGKDAFRNSALKGKKKRECSEDLIE